MSFAQSSDGASVDTAFLDSPELFDSFELGQEIDAIEDLENVEDLNDDPNATTDIERALNENDNRIPPSITQVLAEQSHRVQRTGQDSRPFLAAQRLASSTVNVPRTDQANANPTKEGIMSNGSPSHKSFTYAEIEGRELHQMYNSLDRDLNFPEPYSSEDAASASMRQTALLVDPSVLEVYRARLSRLLTKTARSNTRVKTTNPQAPWNMYPDDLSTQPRSQEDLEEMYRAMVLPQAMRRPRSYSIRRLLASTSRGLLGQLSNASISPRRQSLRPRAQPRVSTDLHDQNYTSDDMILDDDLLRDLQSAPLEMPLRKRRRADGPMEQAVALGGRDSTPDLSEEEQNECQYMHDACCTEFTDCAVLSDSVEKIRRAITGGSPTGQMHTVVPAFTPISQTHPQTALMSQRDAASMVETLQHIESVTNAASPKQHPRVSLPPRRLIKNGPAVFISELFPRRFNKRKRWILLQIFRTKARYVPACVYIAPGMPLGLIYYLSTAAPTLRMTYPNPPLGPGKRGWPAGRVPVEVFNDITEYLPHESVQAMRLVNGEFEMKTSNRHFHTVVVPFRPEIYGMMIHQSEAGDPSKTTLMGKGKGKTKFDEQPEENKTVHDGMKVFEAWGPHIKRFAMAFEVDDATLENAPVKGKFEQHTTWWGGYKWPHPYYNRYKFCEGLEKKADEFKCMSKALSYLKDTRELGLSLDSGLGWLTGPDVSDRARLFQAKSPVFGRRHSIFDAQTKENEEIWQQLTKSASVPSAVRPNQDNFFEVQVKISGKQKVVSLIPPKDQDSSRPLIFEGVDLSTSPSNLDPGEQGRYIFEGLAALAKTNSGRFASATLNPKDLTVSQQEWLLETEWAQRAFLSSFCMALTDNSQTFQHVQTLNISKISSRHLSALQREDIWMALPGLNNLTISVSADWRDIVKSETGIVDAPAMHPSKAATQLYALLNDHVAFISNVKTLHIGYVGGGEHQVGIFGRNKFILPAPLTDYSEPAAVLSPPMAVLRLPHVEHLTFSNCWATPGVLKVFVSQLRLAKLRSLNLNSVSLTSSFPISAEAFNMSPSDGEFNVFQGSPRLSCPTLGIYFKQRRWDVPYPRPDGWAVRGQRMDSWGNVIDAITPGATMDFIRYAFRYHDEPPTPRITNLERLTFESCGYVRLTNYKDFHQYAIEDVPDQLPPCLIKRAVDLYPVMMSCPSDVLLGQIVPSLQDDEQEVLSSAFPMRFGWLPEDYQKSLDNLEDGQPIGGSGRFSGVLEKLLLPMQKR
ncbi:MAG: hypothetical protein Q9164_005919 [Protoblastenia rupestris]